VRLNETLAIGSLSVGVVIASALAVRHLRAENVQHVPFTAERVDIFYLYPSQQIRTTKAATYAKRPDGSFSERRVRMDSDGHPYVIQSFIDTTQRRGVTFDSLTHSITTARYGLSALAEYRTKPSACAMDDPQVTATILGFQVFRSSEPIASASGKTRVNESWVAPALDCYPLRQIQYLSKDGGPAVPVFRSDVTSVRLGQPDGSLFAVPDEGYTERSPSQVFAERQRLLGRNSVCPECEVKRDQILDRSYNATRNP
jgi:hypothetical protein